MAHGHVTMDPRVRLRGTNYDKFLVGKPLTDAKIRKYQKEGKYGEPTKSGGRPALKRRESARRLSSDDILKELAL